MAFPTASQDVMFERVRWPKTESSDAGVPRDQNVLVGEPLVRGMETAFRGYFPPMKYRDSDRTLRGFVQTLINHDDGLDNFGGQEEMARLKAALRALDTYKTEGWHYSWSDFLDLLGRQMAGPTGAVYEEGRGFVVPGEDYGKSLLERVEPYFDLARKRLDVVGCSREAYLHRLREVHPGEYKPVSAAGVVMDVDDGESGEDVVLPSESLRGGAGVVVDDDILRSKDAEIAAIEQQLAALKMADGKRSACGAAVPHLQQQYSQQQQQRHQPDVTQTPQQRSRWQSELQVSDELERRIALRASLPAAVEATEDTYLRKGPLSPAQEQEVDDVFNGGPDLEVLVKAFNADVTRRDLKCLRPETWLNDEVVNMYMQLLAVRDKELCEANPKRRPSHFFNSFFLAKLLQNGKYNYKGVKRWTRKVKVFEMDKVFVPVNISNTHWCMAVIYVQQKRINYYDSMGGGGKSWTNALMMWLEDEDEDKNGNAAAFDPDDWTVVGTNVATTPQQGNGSDCGAFALSFASYISDNLPFDFSQADITQMRRRMLWSLLNQRLV